MHVERKKDIFKRSSFQFLDLTDDFEKDREISWETWTSMFLTFWFVSQMLFFCAN